MEITGSKSIFLTLINEGVDLIFGYPGGAIMPAYDALYDFKKEIKHVLVRHEQGAAFAAAGYARASGKLGVCIATSGPGGTNLITGIADAMLDSVPILCITGQVMSKLIGTDAFQESDIIGMTIPVTKWNYQITNSREIPYILSKAAYIAQSGRPGPVLVDITKDAQMDLLDFKYTKYKDPNKIKIFDDDASIKKSADLINESKRPYIFIGQGVTISKAEDEVFKLAKLADIPVASTLLGLAAFDNNHPLFQGMMGMHGMYGANVLANAADIVIAIGMRFDDRVTGNLENYLKHSKIIHIDIDQKEIDKNVTSYISLNGNAKDILLKLLKYIKPNKHEVWKEKFKEYFNLEKTKVIDNLINPKNGEITMAEVINAISEKTKGKAIMVTDVGQHQMITARYYNFALNRSFITSGGLGSMGFGLPSAIGAKFFNKDKEVIAIIGDGGFQMNIQELSVIKQENLAVKIIILNNSFLGMVRQWQELFFDKKYSFTELTNPDFIKIAQAYSIDSNRVANRKNLDMALDNLLDSKEGYLLEIIVKQEENIFPMVTPGCGVNEVRLI